VQGSWAVTIQYLRGTGEQKFVLEQKGTDVTGEHHGEIYNATFKGAVQGDQVELHSILPVAGNPLHCNFKGTVNGSNMSGTINMGEYGEAKWSAVRA
jgi:hypothetical protein